MTRLEVTSAPVVLVKDVMHAERGGNSALNRRAAQFSVSDSGSLAYVPGGVYPVSEYLLVWVDRDGSSELLPLPPGRLGAPRFSPGGTRLAYMERRRESHDDGVGSIGNSQVWTYDIRLEVPLRLTSEGSNHSPVWSPDGLRDSL